KRFRRVLLSRGVTEEALASVEEEVEEAVRDAMDFALESPYPGPEELLRDVY
ncbi:pyruvate dehydrogenase (acetyl-transferring) E1 component subunit alpha, partial [Candidatus Bathyarchaeota archaeon]